MRPREVCNSFSPTSLFATVHRGPSAHPTGSGRRGRCVCNERDHSRSGQRRHGPNAQYRVAHGALHSDRQAPHQRRAQPCAAERRSGRGMPAWRRTRLRICAPASANLSGQNAQAMRRALHQRRRAVAKATPSRANAPSTGLPPRRIGDTKVASQQRASPRSCAIVCIYPVASPTLNSRSAFGAAPDTTPRQAGRRPELDRPGQGGNFSAQARRPQPHDQDLEGAVGCEVAVRLAANRGKIWTSCIYTYGCIDIHVLSHTSLTLYVYLCLCVLTCM